MVKMGFGHMMNLMVILAGPHNEQTAKKLVAYIWTVTGKTPAEMKRIYDSGTPEQQAKFHAMAIEQIKDLRRELKTIAGEDQVFFGMVQGELEKEFSNVFGKPIT